MTTPSPCRLHAATIKAAFFTLILLLLSLPAPLRAAQSVTAQYGRMAGAEVVIEIAVSEPPPPTLIVIQNLPPQVSVIQAQPETKSVNTGKGEVKWLLSGIKAGALALHLTLDRPLSSAEISGEIRYREPNGDMVSLPISKP